MQIQRIKVLHQQNNNNTPLPYISWKTSPEKSKPTQQNLPQT